MRLLHEKPGVLRGRARFLDTLWNDGTITRYR
ncbi:hypothetical protein SAMN06265795_11397 [Noviherbaspirillum humi]|uniref:Uncharacterized protein n=1 Tax=Noviherbaspirillum humi TaxID=1688639 RepID=A0A239JUF7_9BURK|nr:hypothetical protein SAMN06265795_11397 [Noviherbaspirillum humi]